MSGNVFNTNITHEHTEEKNKEYLRWKRTRFAKYFLSSILAIAGIVILVSQLGPLAMSYMRGRMIETQSQSIKDPTPSDELNPDESDLPYYDPGLSYFQNLIQHIGDASVAGANSGIPRPSQGDMNVKVDENYSGKMSIDIPSIGIQNINITPNVDSFDEDVYNLALKNGVAHFKGTPLPGDGGNSFIYGHSAVESFFTSHPDDQETIFSRLENIEVADTVTIEKDGKILEYTVQKKKITDPEDFDVVSGVTGKETVTLMTCWPQGIGTDRLVVIAEMVDGR